jgi:hypothetical protein
MSMSFTIQLPTPLTIILTSIMSNGLLNHVNADDNAVDTIDNNTDINNVHRLCILLTDIPLHSHINGDYNAVNTIDDNTDINNVQ